MRIDPTALVSINDLRERAGAPAARPADSPSSVVALGEAAAGAQSSAATGDITARIAKIRDDLAAGAYVVDLDKLSERILDDDLERGSAR
jgi:anti-sigma28 factor (negative regulator of flagellin synthesis)